MFSLLQASLLQGFLQCSMLFASGGAVWRFLLLRHLHKRPLYGGEGWVKVKLKTESCPLYVMVTLDFFTAIGLSSFTVQLIIFVLLIVGYELKRQLKFRLHGLVMTSATLLHLALIFGIMVPSLVAAVIPDYIVPNPLTLTSIVGLVHTIVGSTAIVLGVWLVSAWRLSKNFQGCFSRKKTMLSTFTVWLIALVLGAILFAIFYGPVLFS